MALHAARRTAVVPSYVSPLGSVPVRDANLTVTTAPAPVPAGSTHSIEVVVIQILTVHCVKPIDIDGDVSVGPKFVPDNMSVEPPVMGPFAVPRNVTVGAAHRNRAVQ